MHQSKASFLRLTSRTAGSGKSPAFMLGPAGLGLFNYLSALRLDLTEGNFVGKFQRGGELSKKSPKL